MAAKPGVTLARLLPEICSGTSRSLPLEAEGDSNLLGQLTKILRSLRVSGNVAVGLKQVLATAGSADPQSLRARLR